MNTFLHLVVVIGKDFVSIEKHMASLLGILQRVMHLEEYGRKRSCRNLQCYLSGKTVENLEMPITFIVPTKIRS